MTWPSSYEKGIYRAVVSQRLRNTGVDVGLYMATDGVEIEVIHEEDCRFD